MTGQLYTHYFLTDGIRATPEWQASAADPHAFAAFREAVLQRYETLNRSAEPNEAVTEQDLIRPVLELLGWTRLPAAAGHGRQGGHSRPPSLRRRRFQGARRRRAQRRRPRPIRGRVRGEQALRPVPGRARQGGRFPRPIPPQPDSPLPGHSRNRVGEPRPLGHPHQRPGLAPVRLPCPSPRQRLLRGRPRRPP